MMTKALTLISKLPTGFSYSNESIASWHDYLQWVAKKKLAFRLVYIALDFHILKTQTSVNFHTFYWHFSCSRVSNNRTCICTNFPLCRSKWKGVIPFIYWAFELILSVHNIKLSFFVSHTKRSFDWRFNGNCTVIGYSSLSCFAFKMEFGLTSK